MLLLSLGRLSRARREDRLRRCEPVRPLPAATGSTLLCVCVEEAERRLRTLALRRASAPSSLLPEPPPPVRRAMELRAEAEVGRCMDCEVE